MMIARKVFKTSLVLAALLALANCGGSSTSTPAVASFSEVQRELNNNIAALNSSSVLAPPTNQEVSYQGTIILFETGDTLTQFSPLGVPGLDLNFVVGPDLDLDFAAIGELDIVVGFPAPGGRGTITGSADNFYEVRNPNSGVDTASSRGSIDGSINFGRNGVISGELDKVSGETASYELRSGDFGFVLAIGNNAEAIVGGAIGVSSASGRAPVNAGATFLGER